jgi:cyclophilin family peptidyl-prolyl cis-trans isomerase/HEAT repeat protein
MRIGPLYGALREFCVLGTLTVLTTTGSYAQTQGPAVTRLAVLQAENRRAPTVRDLALIRSGTRSSDPETARIAVRALGRLERPPLVSDILPVLNHPLPEVRAEGANALGQALKGTNAEPAASAQIADSVVGALITRLSIEVDPAVRGAIYETLGRAATTEAQIERVEAVLVEAAGREASNDGRLGVASGFEALVRLHRHEHPPARATIDAMRSMVSLVPLVGHNQPDPARDVRVRRVALEALVTAEAVDAPTLQRAERDPDPQVRRLAMRAVPATGGVGTDRLTRGLADNASMVRLEALRAMRGLGADVLCPAATAAAADRDPHVALAALDQLSACSAAPDAIALLERVAGDPADVVGSARGWHRAAHALTALAAAAPERSKALIARVAGSPVWQLRMYAARAATRCGDTSLLEKLAEDDDDNVREAAVDGLAKIAGHSADAVYVRQLIRHGNQILRAAAAALEGTPNPDAAVPALEAAHARLVVEGRDNSHDARAALEKTLSSVGTRRKPRSGPSPSSARSTRAANGAESRPDPDDLDAGELRRLASARANVTIRGVGTFALVFLADEAPATVLRFGRLAGAGYYNGLTFHRVVPNFVIQGGSPGANEYIGDATFMRDEVGRWPHVRGAVGISTRGRDTGDAQLFIDLVDNPRLNHQYTVFAHVLNGIDVVEQILEGDVIEKIEIVLR